MKLITKNKKALFDYDILDNVEAGIVLTGDEVKSLRAGQVNMTGTYAQFHKGELFIIGLRISPYSHAFQKNDDEAERSRKLLLHKKQLMQLFGDMSKKGITLIPLKLYFSRGLVKVEIGVAKHKKAAGKKKEKRERDIKRETERELKNVYKYN